MTLAMDRAIAGFHEHTDQFAAPDTSLEVMTFDRPPRAIVRLRSGHRPVADLVVPGSTRCDLRLVEDLLRLRLNAVRMGWSMDLSEVAHDLQELFDLVGLNAYSSNTKGNPNASK